jgi:hypothetical protein
MGVTLRGAPPGLPFIMDARTLEQGSNFTFDTPWIGFDILGHVEPLGGYDQLLPRSEREIVGTKALLMISLDDLIRVKEHIKRAKDGESLMQLLAIKRIREEGLA